MSLNDVLISVATTCENSIANIVGTDNVTIIFKYSCGTKCIIAILKQLAYPTHLTGFATLDIALKYSLTAKSAIITNAISTTILFPIRKIANTSGNPNSPDVNLFISIFYFIPF